MIPAAQRWLFWDVDPQSIELERDRRYVLGRVLERGRLSDVCWAVAAYGLSGVRDFFEAGPHPEVSRRTLSLWRAVLGAEGDAWPSASSWRQSSTAPWID